MKGPMPPWHQYRDFLPPEELAGLLEFTLDSREKFIPSALAGGVIDPERRVSERLVTLGPVRAIIEERLRALFPDMVERTGVRPFEPEFVELEIAAHGDGAFFHRHRDIPVGPGRAPLGGDRSGSQDRLLSAVLYFYREPKAFSGGALRLYRIGGDVEAEEDRVEIEPLQNSLLVFPSWATHEVCRVSCPGNRFEDHRFAVNAWFCKTLPQGRQ
jgi:Rps23 Pro-64 3,4-dihydroxylase Tpa1-like proline 4-hydroxylase